MAFYKILVIGLLGALLMFLGDMVLYYSKDDYKDKDAVNSIISIMKQVSIKRLYIGGLLGPISAFIYCIGFYHIILIAQTSQLKLAWIIFFINVLGLILGGAYHAQCAYLGLLSRYENNGFFEEYISYLKFQAKIIFAIIGLGSFGLSIMILLGYTIIPRWVVLFTPIVLIFLTPLVGKLPKSAHMIIRGGWNNIIYIIYYLVAIVVLI